MNLKITAAVAAALACSAPAFALDIAGTTGATVKLVTAGASAQRDAFLVLMVNGVCQAGTFDMYRIAPTANQDFRAYSCRVVNDAVTYGAAANQTATVFYRSEGGSAFGAAPIATNTPVMRLNVDASCTTTSTATINGVVGSYTIHDCALPANDYQLVGTTVANADISLSNNAHLVKDTVNLAVADVEPKLFAGVNFPSSHVFDNYPVANRQAAMNTLNAVAQVGFAQVFGIIVNNVATGAAGSGVATATASPFNGLGDGFSVSTRPNLSREAIAGIFNGTYVNWSQVPTITGGKVSSTSLTIRVCRREPGSGTQVVANQYFLGTTQCAPPVPLGTFRVDGPDPDDTNFVNDTDGVIERGASGDLAACVGGLAGGIGMVSANAAPANTSYVTINGAGPSREAAAIGAYDFWYEQTFAVNPGLAAGAVANLATGLITGASTSTSAPNSLSVLSLPNGSNDPFLQGAFVSTRPPISFGTRGGNSCTAIAPLTP